MHYIASDRFKGNANVYMDALAGVLNPGTKLWNTGVGATMMREAVSLVGGYGITEDCPGFLCHKWMDAQLEATYEGPEAVQRRHMSLTMTNPVFLAVFRLWADELRRIEAATPGLGAAALAAAMDQWLWTLAFLQGGMDRDGKKLYHGKRQGVSFPLADALGWLISARFFIKDVLVLAAEGPMNPVVAEGLEGLTTFYNDMAFVHSARTAGEVVRICTELVYGYGCGEDQGVGGDVCIVFEGQDEFLKLRQATEQSLYGVRLAKDRAAGALTQVMIPEALDYPM